MKLCHPVVVFPCTQPGCNYSCGRRDVTVHHLATVHDVYLPGDKKITSVAPAHLSRKLVEALRTAYLRDSNELNNLRVQFASWESIRHQFEHVGARRPLLSEMTDPPAVTDPEIIRRWAKRELIGQLIEVRMVLFGPNFGEPGNWNAFDEVAAITEHVEALRNQATQPQPFHDEEAGDSEMEVERGENPELGEQSLDDQILFQLLGAIPNRHLGENSFVEHLGALRGPHTAEDRALELLEEMEDEA